MSQEILVKISLKILKEEVVIILNWNLHLKTSLKRLMKAKLSDHKINKKQNKDQNWFNQDQKQAQNDMLNQLEQRMNY
jgi:hypothetical protein